MRIWSMKPQLRNRTMVVTTEKKLKFLLRIAIRQTINKMAFPYNGKYSDSDDFALDMVDAGQNMIYQLALDQNLKLEE